MQNTLHEALSLRLKAVDYAARRSDWIIQLFNKNRALGYNVQTKLNNCKAARQEAGQINIREIFEKYWKDFSTLFSKRLTRKSIIDNVEAMLGCGKFENGYLFFECLNPDCPNFHLQAFTCKSRFCQSCGKKYNDERVIEISKKCLDVKHRHIVFTIPKELRKYIQKDRSLIDCLFDAVNNTLTFMAYKRSKHKKYKFGFICTLHTFGRDLKFNPHIHVLIAECVIDKNCNQVSHTHFHYEQLRKSFQKSLLDFFYKKIKNKEFKILKNNLYNSFDNGFYVYAPSIKSINTNDNKSLIKYVVRYAGHPAISESRITNIDYGNNTISYYYDPHEDDNIEDGDLKLGRQFVTEHIYDFIGKLIVHIPENGKHNIRYYGFYANKSKKMKTSKFKDYKKLYTNKQIAKMRKELLWRNNILKSFDYDILMCDNCGETLDLVPDMCFIPPTYRRRSSYG